MDGPVIAVNLNVGFLSTLFDGCATVGKVSTSYGLHNQEFGAPTWCVVELSSRSIHCGSA